MPKSKGPPSKYPFFATMEVGDSFFVEVAHQQIQWASFKVCASAIGARLKRTFKVVLLEDGCWQVCRWK
jgi:hypothetical protein